MFVEILNSKIINRPTAEVQPSVEDYGYMNHHICIFREAPVRCWVPLNCSMPAGIKVAKSFIRRLKYLNRKYCSHSAGRNGTTKVLVCPAQSCAKREHRGKERITRLPGDWGRNPCGVSRIKVKALIFIFLFSILNIKIFFLIWFSRCCLPYARRCCLKKISEESSACGLLLPLFILNKIQDYKAHGQPGYG